MKITQTFSAIPIFRVFCCRSCSTCYLLLVHTTQNMVFIFVSISLSLSLCLTQYFTVRFCYLQKTNHIRSMVWIFTYWFDLIAILATRKICLSLPNKNCVYYNGNIVCVFFFFSPSLCCEIRIYG